MPSTVSTVVCDHCGDPCIEEVVEQKELSFCCNGCAMVYNVLADNQLGSYYKYTDKPGISQRQRTTRKYDFLDDAEIVANLLSFDESKIQRITLHLPQIHCSSCLWLLENLDRLNPAVMHVRVDFAAKKATIQYRSDQTTLRILVELLDQIGYPPTLQLDQLDNDTKTTTTDKATLYRLGLAGFAFGNIMLLSFPEYLGYEKASVLMHIGYINLLLATPVLLYSGWDYIKSAWQSIYHRHLNIDVPVAIGMITLYARSAYEILGHHGEGYLDSFAGFVFFLLIGRWFQQFTVSALDFDRTYTSYFPISATIFRENTWTTIPLRKISKDDRLLIRNEELIPADGVIMAGKGRVDYSFVTGEADLISKSPGDTVLAGGKQRGESIEIRVSKPVHEAYLTQLWNEDTFRQQDPTRSSRLISAVSTYFTYAIILIALATMVYWYVNEPAIVFDTFTAVLIVACPCALALSIPFTYGNILRILAERSLYLRHVNTVELIQEIDHVIFDKTGTLTDSTSMQLSYHGMPLLPWQEQLIKSSCTHSSHPLSRAITKHLSHSNITEIDSYMDVVGSGIITRVADHQLRLGSSAMIFGTESSQARERGVFVEIDGRYIGNFQAHHRLRDGVHTVVDQLTDRYHLSVLSGDNSDEAARINEVFDGNASLHWSQQPKDKLNYIKALQAQGQKVLMIGDGLNDAGALRQSDVGLVIADSANNFSPACEGIIAAENFAKLGLYITYLRRARLVIIGAMVIAFLYNSIGLYFAVTGALSPVIAAILMPVSSISVILYGVISSIVLARITLGKKRKNTKNMT